MAAVPTIPLSPAEMPPRKRFTRAEVHQMLDLGLFDGQRFELIEGDLIDKMGQKPPHANAIRLINTWLAGVFGAILVQVQLPIDVAPEDQELNEPEPDLAVLAESKPEYDTRHPRGDELLLIVEVAQSSARFDLSVKGALYARAGVPEYWVVDVVRRTLTVHRAPEEGRYQSVARFSEEDAVIVGSRPDAAIAVKSLLPSA